MIFLTGDTHGDIDIRKLSSSRFSSLSLDKSDYVIILGDFGFLWEPEQSKHEYYWLNWLKDKPFTTLVVDGNHENFFRINSLPKIKLFGGTVGYIYDSVFHLKRGEIYNIDDNKIFVMGGANSIDKEQRTTNISWWTEEIPSYKEFEYGLKNLENNNYKVDYILGHTCPEKIALAYLQSLKISNMFNDNDITRKYFDTIIEYAEFKKFYFGHWHDNKIFEDGKYVMLYNSIVELGKDFTDRDYTKIC
jgi:predicted phosphodiesterase